MSMIKKQVIHIASRVMHQALTLIAPPLCAYCKEFLEEDTILCNACYNTIIPIVSYTMPVNRYYQLRVHALSAYQDPLRCLILAKGRSDRTTAYQLGQLLSKNVVIQHLPIDYFVPVPLYWTRLAKRGYNQARVIAQAVGSDRKIPVVDLVKRIHWTAYQSTLEFEERFKNVQSAFKIKANHYERYHNKHLVLVDDLMTTGATLQAVAKVLTVLKPASISAIVVCRVV